MRVTAVMPEGMINSIYRSILPMQEVARRGHRVHIEERTEIQDARPLLESDVVHILRFAEPVMQRLARRLHDAGVAIVWDNDDNLTASLPGNPNYADRSGLHGQRIRAGVAAMVRTANVVTTPSEVLAEHYRELGGRDVRVLENYLPPGFTRPRTLPHPGVRVGWLAAPGHQRDLERLGLREVFERLLQRHQHVAVLTIGVNLGLRSRRYTHVPGCVYGELPALLAELDVGIAPIADVDLNRARSNVKVKEYAAVGVPWLASPIGPYAWMGEEQGGRLVPDGRWEQEIERLVVDAESRSRLAHRARRWAQGETIERHADRWERALEDALAARREPSHAR